jgi:hypothetical protein
MASKEPKISKLVAAVITRDLTLIIPRTHEIFSKMEVLQASVIMAPQNTALFTIYGITKHNKKSPIQT